MSDKRIEQVEIIGISGKQYSGKDLLAGLIRQICPDFRQVPLALAIKQEYARQNGLTLEEIEQHKAQHRPGLIALGDWGRAQDPDYWIKRVLERPGKKIISDVRLKREHDILRRYGALLIRLNADRDVRAGRGILVSETDPTECDLDDVTDWDLVLTNQGTPAELLGQLKTAFGVQ